jgi:MFS superfamily sulfate permease-like transporter
MDNSSARSAILDRMALALSGLCLLHCLLLPFLVAVLPFLGQFSDDHLHAELLIVVLPVSIIALILGYRRHRNIGVVAWGAAGLIVLTIGGTIAHSVYGLLLDRTMTVVGSITLAITHYRNFRLSKQAIRSSLQ